MAKFKATTKPKPWILDQYLGINESVGKTEIKKGELIECENFRITKNYKLQKRGGHHTFINFGSGNVQGVWYGQIASKTIMLACWNGTIYEYDMTASTTTTAIADLITEGTVTTVGSITDAKTSIFWFQSKIYFMNGTDYKEYDGTTYQDVVAHVPTIAINAPPAGGGTLFEEINLLTGEKTQTFIGDGSSTLYQLAEVAIDADTLAITIDGVSKTEGVDFTVNRTLGQVTFTVGPTNGSSVSITWHKDVAGNPELIKNHKYAVDFGVSNDTNLFIWGNPNEKNRFRFSGILDAGYFPANSFVTVGTNQFRITDLKAQYQTLLVFKKNETKIVRPESNPLFASNSGLNPFNYPYFDLNESVGNLADKGVQLIENNPLSLDGFSMWLWSSATGVEDERNAKIVSDRIKLSLQELDLSTAITFDYQNQKEYWLNLGSTVYIWNYGNNTFYTYTNINATQFLDVEGVLYYASNGTVEKFSESFLADGQSAGTTIPCRAATGFTDFGYLSLEKDTRSQYVSISPASKTSVDIKYVTDEENESESEVFTIALSFLNFSLIPFAEFSFLSNVNPQTQDTDGRIKKFVFFQIVYENNTNDEFLTVLKHEIKLQTRNNR